LISNETINAATKTVKIVIGINERNLPNVPGKVKSGINTTHVVVVDAINGVLNSWSAKRAAEYGEYHNFLFSAAHSNITIIVSMAIPNVTIILKLVRKLSVIPITWNTKNVIRKANGIDNVAIIDSFNETKSNTAKNTKTNVMSPFFVTES
jgi:hypothetical protein